MPFSSTKLQFGAVACNIQAKRYVATNLRNSHLVNWGKVFICPCYCINPRFNPKSNAVWRKSLTALRNLLTNPIWYRRGVTGTEHQCMRLHTILDFDIYWTHAIAGSAKQFNCPCRCAFISYSLFASCRVRILRDKENCVILPLPIAFPVEVWSLCHAMFTEIEI